MPGAIRRDQPRLLIIETAGEPTFVIKGSISDSAGRTVSYGFDATTGLLTSVTGVLGGVTQYQYSGELLTKVIDVSVCFVALRVRSA